MKIDNFTQLSTLRERALKFFREYNFVEKRPTWSEEEYEFNLNDLVNFKKITIQKIKNSKTQVTKNKYLKIESYLDFLTDYIKFTYKNETDFYLNLYPYRDKCSSAAMISFTTNRDVYNLYYNLTGQKLLHEFALDKLVSIIYSSSYYVNGHRDLKNLIKVLMVEKCNFEKLIKNLKNSDFSNVEFFNIYKNFYKWDTYKIIELANQSKFKESKLFRVMTDHYIYFTVSEGRGKDFSYWNEFYEKGVEFYASKDFKLENREYSLQELAQLQKNDLISVVGTFYGKKLTDEEYKIRYIKYNDCKVDPLTNEIQNSLYELVNSTIEEMEKIDKKNPIIIQTIRDNLNFEQLKHDYKIYIDYFKKTVKNIKEELLRQRQEQIEKRDRINEKIEELDQAEQELKF